MVTVDQLKGWNADQLGRIADELHSRRSALTDLADEVTAGRPPASWVGGASVYAEQDHDQLANRLTDQVAELNMVISALDTASGAVRSARTQLDDALARAASNGCTVSDDGRAESNRTYDDEDELEDAQRVVDEIAQAVEEALSKAVDADIDLAAALWSASGADVDAAGGLGDQTLPDALRGLSTEEQVDYLLDHPDLADVMIPSLPGALKDELGQGLSDLVDSQVNDPDGLIDEDEAARLSTVLDAYGGDSDIASSMFTDLGADGTVASMHSLEERLRLGGDDPAVRGLADDLRRTLGIASNDPQFDSDEFGRDLVRFATGRADEDQLEAYQDRYPNVTGANGAAVLTYLMGNHHLDGDLVESVAVELDAWERSGEDYLTAENWYRNTSSGYLGSDSFPNDPMAAALGNLGSHPEDAYDFLTDDPDRQDYYFHERDWEPDGFEGVTRLVEGLGTDDDLAYQHPQQQAEIVSRFLHGIATNDSFSVENAQAGSPYLGDLMKHYTPAIDGALHSPSNPTEPGAGVLPNEHLGDFPHSPTIFRDDLRELMQVAVSTDEGATSIAEGIGGYQQAQVNAAAADLAADPQNPAKFNELKAILQGTGALHGLAESAVGSVEIADAQEHDARVQAFADLVSDAAGMVPLPGAGLAGEALSTAWEQGVDLGSGALVEAYGNTTDAVAATAENRADVGSTNVKINAYLTLVEAGVIPESAVDPMWRTESGGLISPSDIGPNDLTRYGTDAGDGIDDFVSPDDLAVAYKNQFTPYYHVDG